MGANVRINCINKSKRDSRHERISSIGGIDSKGERWRMDLDDAITAIKNNTHSFYVLYKHHKVGVIISRSSLGNLYLKTVADGKYPNNLLSLKECPLN
jgi:hypothetical protein